MSAQAETTVSGLKETAQQVLNAREEFGRSDESWGQKRELKKRLTSYLTEEKGLDTNKAEQQASEIATDAAIGHLDDAKLKIEAIDVIFNIAEENPVKAVKDAALDFYQKQKRFERGSDVYIETREELRHTAVEYFDSAFESDIASQRQADRITTEVALGGGHIYDAIEKLDAIEKMRTTYEGEI